MKNQKIRHLSCYFLLLMLLVTMLAMPAYAADSTTPTTSPAGDIAGVVTDIWTNASGQIKTICNKAVFPALSVTCAIGFAIAVIVSVVNFKKHHTVEVGWAIALLIGLLASLTAPTWVWALAGI